jgi:hypothetical protein
MTQCHVSVGTKWICSMLLEFDDNKLLKEQIEIAYACSNVQDPFA